MTTSIQTRQSEKGNVLFLILIAVALFAALSYVVTQSTRSGGGSTDREKNILSSAQMTQYPTALRTALIRMILNGVPIENVRFNTPGSFSASTNLDIFHPQGGGAIFMQAPSELSANTLPLSWSFNANFDVPGIGIDGVAGNDVIAFLPGVSAAVCRQVNEELNIAAGTCTMFNGVPQVAAAVLRGSGTSGYNAQMVAAPMANPYTFPVTDQVDLQCTGGTAFARQASGCFYDPTTTPVAQYVFYSVLLER